MREWNGMLKTSATGPTSKCAKSVLKKLLMTKKRRIIALSKRPFCECAACLKMRMLNEKLHMQSRFSKRTSRWPSRSDRERQPGQLIKNHRTKLRRPWQITTRFSNWMAQLEELTIGSEFSLIKSIIESLKLAQPKINLSRRLRIRSYLDKG